jgi:hypothetical protein
MAYQPLWEVGCCKVAVAVGVGVAVGMMERMEGLAMFEGQERLTVVGHYKVRLAMFGLGNYIRLVERMRREVGKAAIVVW